jgi:hypothetical protein
MIEGGGVGVGVGAFGFGVEARGSVPVIVFESLHRTAASSDAAANTNGTAIPVCLLFTVHLLQRGARPRDFAKMEEGRKRSLHRRLGDFWDFARRMSDAATL